MSCDSGRDGHECCRTHTVMETNIAMNSPAFQGRSSSSKRGDVFVVRRVTALTQREKKQWLKWSPEAVLEQTP